MRKDTAIEYADQLLYERTGKHLSDLQSHILQQSWQGCTYGQVASAAGYSEGHVKDVASQLWKALSEALGERITKGNLRSRLINRAKRTFKHAAPDTYESIASVVRPSFPSLSSQPYPPVQARTSPPQAPLCAPLNPHFLGRAHALKTLQAIARIHRIVVIKGEGGIGKTTLAQQFAQQFDRVLSLPMAKETANITPAESVVAEWLRQHFDEEPGGEFGITLSRLQRHLQSTPQRTAVLIDNLEPALDGSGQFVGAHRHYVELLRALAEGQSHTSVIITSRDRLCEPGIKVHHYRLPGLSVEAWQQFFSAISADASVFNASESDAAIDREAEQTVDKSRTHVIAKMHRAYGGNAKAMEILCATALGDYEGDVSAYWAENGTDLLGTADLRNLIVSQIDRLQQLDADAYRVFCRLGCYRYQDQPMLNAAAIAALMWDISPARQRQTINSLRDRSLLEFRKGNYWLHPVSRAEAIGRLRQSDDWQQANAAAATYWSEQAIAITSTEDALKALESYYHRMAAKDHNGAAEVLLKSRHNQWQQFLPLASSLYRMGFLQPVTHAITRVLPFVDTETRAHSELNNILGDVHWIAGRVHEAIDCQNLTLAGAQQESLRQAQTQQQTKQAEPAAKTCDLSEYYLKMLTVDAHLSVGLYAIDLWELDRAQAQFEKVIALSEGSAHQAWADKAAVALALVRAHKSQVDSSQVKDAIALADSLYNLLISADKPGQYAYFVQLLGRAYDVLGERSRAELLYKRAIAFAKAGHYLQVKSQALTGLARLHRQRGCFEKAFSLHSRAIEQSEIIGAKCDLAEAYFQMGLSRLAHRCSHAGTAHSPAPQSPPPYPAAQPEIEQAKALFHSISAPRQVARIEDALRKMC